MGSDTLFGVLIVINFVTRSLYLVFLKGTCLTNWCQTFLGGIRCDKCRNTFTSVWIFERHMLKTLGPDTRFGLLIALNVATHSLQLLFWKGIYVKHTGLRHQILCFLCGQWPNTFTAVFFDIHTPHPRWKPQFWFMAIFTCITLDELNKSGRGVEVWQM